MREGKRESMMKKKLLQEQMVRERNRQTDPLTDCQSLTFLLLKLTEDFDDII